MNFVFILHVDFLDQDNIGHDKTGIHGIVFQGPFGLTGQYRGDQIISQYDISHLQQISKMGHDMKGFIILSKISFPCHFHIRQRILVHPTLGSHIQGCRTILIISVSMTMIRSMSIIVTQFDIQNDEPDQAFGVGNNLKVLFALPVFFGMDSGKGVGNEGRIADGRGIDEMNGIGHFGNETETSRESTRRCSIPTPLVTKDQIVSTEGYHIARDGKFHMFGIVFEIFTDHFGGGFDADRCHPCQIRRKGLRMRQTMKIKVKAMPSRFHGNDMFSHLCVFGQCHFQQNQSLSG
mmetsp:Transcript_29332/g.53688  ORF Transcript_29332/g.53688 Transcript_29332/m.53688 type:complete len:292 (-) Transcript_29332:881-1756(-)